MPGTGLIYFPHFPHIITTLQVLPHFTEIWNSFLIYSYITANFTATPHIWLIFTILSFLQILFLDVCVKSCTSDATTGKIRWLPGKRLREYFKRLCMLEVSCSCVIDVFQLSWHHYECGFYSVVSFILSSNYQLSGTVDSTCCVIQSFYSPKCALIWKEQCYKTPFNATACFVYQYRYLIDVMDLKLSNFLFNAIQCLAV